jgi:inner membrane protease subunit 2
MAHSSAGRRAALSGFSLRLLGWATWIPVFIVFKSMVAELVLIEGASMRPYLNTDINSTLRRDVAVNYKLFYRRNLARGMIVTLRFVAK